MYLLFPFFFFFFLMCCFIMGVGTVDLYLNGRKEMFYLTMQGHMASDVWENEEGRNCFI